MASHKCISLPTMLRFGKQVITFAILVAFVTLAALVTFNITSPSDNTTKSNRRLSPSDGITFQGIVPKKENDEDQKFGFIHIPKTGGSSFLRESPKHMRQGSTMHGNHEESVFRIPSKRKNTVVFLRDPYRHVLSQYLECKYDIFGKQVTHGTGFPGRHKMKKILGGYKQWVRHFVKSKNIVGRSGAYNCYNPWNMQARYLALKGVAHLISKTSQKEPSLEDAMKNLNSLGLVGITDYFDASVCLFEYKALGKLLPNCKCNTKTQSLIQSKKTKHSTHNVPKHSIEDVDEETMAMVKKLTEVDRALYSYALTVFSKEIKKVADETGVDLLCGESAEE